MRFFERFRQALARYAEGVHDVGAPAGEAAITAAEARLGRRLPSAYREFVAQWNGALLFHDDVTLAGVTGGVAAAGEVGVEGGHVRVGEQGGGALLLDDEGRVRWRDPETEREALVGSDFERWLDALMAREALVYQPDGEFRDEAFDGDGLTPKAARRRAEAGVRADPGAAAWHEELGVVLVEAGRVDEAARALEQAVALDPTAADAWCTLARLRREASDVAGALAAWRGAAGAETAPEEIAFALGQAARAALALGRADEARALAAEALGRHGAFVAEQRAAAQHLAAEGDLDGAAERLELALAVAPDDAEAARLASLVRARRALKPIG